MEKAYNVFIESRTLDRDCKDIEKVKRLVEALSEWGAKVTIRVEPQGEPYQWLTIEQFLKTQIIGEK